MRKIPGMRKIVVRFEIKVQEGSDEEAVLDYLLDKTALPQSRQTRFMMASMVYWLPQALQHKGCSPEKIALAMQDVACQWQSHQCKNQRIMGVDLGYPLQSGFYVGNPSTIHSGLPAVPMLPNGDSQSVEVEVASEYDNGSVASRLFQDSIIVYPEA